MKTHFNQAEAVPPADALQHQLVALVTQLGDPAQVQTGIFRQLLQLAREHGVAAEEFRHRLVRAGLAYSRASELKVVLTADTVCADFLKPAAASERLSWRQALQAARTLREQNETRTTPLERLAARVAALLHRTGQSELPVPGGWLVLELRAGDLETLS